MAVAKKRKSRTTRKKVKRSSTKKRLTPPKQLWVKGYVYDLRRDKKRVAKHPGKRVSKSGKVYYERRVNRSDRNRRIRL